MLSYCLVSSLFTPRVRILRKGRRYVLGRDRRTDFPLPSEVVSRRHAEIEWDAAGGFVIRDLESKNGTKVNGTVVEQHLLKDGDSIWLGPFHLSYREYSGDISGLLEEVDEGEATVSLTRDILAGGGGGGGAFVFGGRYSGSELLEIIQLLGLNEKSGVLNVTTGELRGSLAFLHGDVVRARLGRRAGEGAALALLGTSEGAFEFVAGDPGDGEICIAAESLIIEAARLSDEGGETRTIERSFGGLDETAQAPSGLLGEDEDSVRDEGGADVGKAGPDAPSAPDAADAAEGATPPPPDKTPRRGSDSAGGGRAQ